MRVSDVLRAGGRPGVSAYPQTADLTRFDVVDGTRREIAVLQVDLAGVLRGDPAADVLLQPFDVLTVKQVPDWSDAEFVTLEGEIRFPGTYPIRKGETLRSVLERAGGILPDAFIEGAVFTRESLRQREREQLDRMAERLQSDLAVLALRNAQSNEKGSDSDQTLLVGRGLLADLQKAQPVGRLVLNLSTDGPEGAAAVELRDGDRLMIPRQSQSVTVLGEVQSPTSLLWREGLDRDDYIGLSGGLTAKADASRVYVVRADGSVVMVQNRYFGGAGREIRPGDTIVAPLDAERMRALPMWTSVTQIIYNLAVAVLAITSI
jgi:protein involved in polysaccharide export with SLBB domain